MRIYSYVLFQGFYSFSAYVWIFDPLGVSLCLCCEVRDHLHSLACGYPVVPTPFIKNIILGEFPGGLVVKILGFHCCGLGSISDQGTESLQAVWGGQKIEKKNMLDHMTQLNVSQQFVLINYYHHLVKLRIL